MIEENQDEQGNQFADSNRSQSTVVPNQQSKIKMAKLTPHSLCKYLQEPNKYLIGRILCMVPEPKIRSILAQVQLRQQEGAIDSRASMFIKAIKHQAGDMQGFNLNKRAKKKALKRIFDKRNFCRLKQQVEYSFNHKKQQNIKKQIEYGIVEQV